MAVCKFEFVTDDPGLVMRATYFDAGCAVVLVACTGWQTPEKWAALDSLRWQPKDGHTFCRPIPWRLEFHLSGEAAEGMRDVAFPYESHTRSEVCAVTGAAPCYIRGEREVTAAVSDLFILLTREGSARFWEAMASLHRQHFNSS